jgi:hypothetical protein
MANETTLSGEEFGDSYEDYLVARLALWAGDTEEAIVRLEKYGTGRNKDPLTDLARASAATTLRQLHRRLGEYESIYAASNIQISTTNEFVLKSPLGNVRGVIWVEGDREFELRAYLLHTNLEERFYLNAKRLASMANTGGRIETALRYGVAAIERRDPKQDLRLDLEWVVEGSCFLQVAVSDFCTFTARGIWTLKNLPTDLAQVTKPFQLLLNEFDAQLGASTSP